MQGAASELMPLLWKHVDPDKSRLMTDEYHVYKGLDPYFAGGHHTTQHTRLEYVRKGTDIHSNTVESVFLASQARAHGDVSLCLQEAPTPLPERV